MRPGSLMVRSFLVAAGLGCALLVMWSVIAGPSIGPDRLDGLAAGYDVVSVSDFECGSGATSLCSRSFEIRHQATDDDLIRELRRLDIEVAGDGAEGSLVERSPGQAVLVLTVVVTSPNPFAVQLHLLLVVCFALALVCLVAASVSAALSRLRRGGGRGRMPWGSSRVGR